MIDFMRFLRVKEPEERTYTLDEYPPSATLPFSLREAVNSQQGKISKKDVLPVIDTLPLIATYYVMKMLHTHYNNNEIQIILATLLNATDSISYKEALRQSLSRVPENTTIKGSKPFSVSRYGFDTYQTWWKTFYEEHRQVAEAGSLCILGLSPVIGLRQVLPLLKQGGSPVFFALLNKKDNTLNFFEITKTDSGIIEVLPKKQDLPKQMTFVDDVSQTGDTEKKVLSIMHASHPDITCTYTALIYSGNDSENGVEK